MKKVIITIGIPGIGKSTWMANYLAGTNHVILNADRVRQELYGDPQIQGDGREVFGLIKNRFINALHDKAITHIGLDNTSLSFKLRKQYIDICRERFFEEKIDWLPHFVIVYFHPNILLAKERNAGRDRVVPEHVIDDMASRCPKPTKFEYENFEIIEIGAPE